MTQIMEPGYEICHCKKGTFGDVEDALQQLPHFCLLDTSRCV